MVPTVLEWSEVVLLLYISTALQHALEGQSTNEFRMRPLFQSSSQRNDRDFSNFISLSYIKICVAFPFHGS